MDILHIDLAGSGPTHGGLSARRASLVQTVIADPATLPAALAALLDAEIVTATKRNDVQCRRDPAQTLCVPSPWNAPLIFQRWGRPFTHAEAADARRLVRCCRVAVDVRDDGAHRRDSHR